MGRIEWDVKNCMQSRQDYRIAVKGKRRDNDSKGHDPGGARTCAEICRVTTKLDLTGGGVCAGLCHDRVIRWNHDK